MVARRTARLNSGVDALLATVTDRAAGASSSGTASDISNARSDSRNVTSTDSCDLSLSCQNVTKSTSLYPDLIRAANERRKIMKVL